MTTFFVFVLLGVIVSLQWYMLQRDQTRRSSLPLRSIDVLDITSHTTLIVTVDDEYLDAHDLSQIREEVASVFTALSKQQIVVLRGNVSLQAMRTHPSGTQWPMIGSYVPGTAMVTHICRCGSQGTLIAHEPHCPLATWAATDATTRLASGTPYQTFGSAYSGEVRSE